MSRLEQALEGLGLRASSKKCVGMQGLIEDGQESIEEAEDGPVRDAALIAAAQRAEHYEMAGYGTARTFATLLGHGEMTDAAREHARRGEGRRREAHGDCGSDGESGSSRRARVQPARSPKRDRAHGGMAGIDRGCRGQSDGPACGSFEGQSTAGSERLQVTRRFQRGTGARAIHRREAARHELACCQRDGRDTPAAARISRRAQGAQGTQSALTSVLDDDVGPDRRPDARAPGSRGGPEHVAPARSPYGTRGAPQPQFRLHTRHLQGP